MQRPLDAEAGRRTAEFSVRYGIYALNGNHAKEAGTHGRFFAGLIKTIGNFL